MVIRDNSVKEIRGGERNTTNQRMELTACIKGLEEIQEKGAEVEVYSDSAYLVNCLQQKWYEKWRKNGWRNAKRGPVENRDLWEMLLNLVAKHKASVRKVEGHSGIEMNERADALAREAVGKAQDPAEQALAIESFVHEALTQKDFSTAFATAAEVARSRSGDCTEHAVLTAALCRAQGFRPASSSD